MTKTKIGTVYKLYTPSGKTYVGSTTKTMHYRMKAHILSYYANIKNPNYICCSANTLFQETIDVKCEILEEIVYSNKKELRTRENFHLQLLKAAGTHIVNVNIPGAMNNGYNEYMKMYMRTYKKPS